MTATVYQYRSGDGHVAYEVVRGVDRDGGKTFTQRQPSNNGGGPVYNMDGVARIPYRLPELAEAGDKGGIVWIVEGEKDADRLADLGLIATTNPGGAGKYWTPDWAEYFRGLERVYIIPDNDDPGRKHAHRVAGVVANVVDDVRIVTLHGLDVKGDVSDWLDLHLGNDIDILWKVAEAAPTWKRPTDTPVNPDGGAKEQEKKASQATLLVRLALEHYTINLAADGLVFAVPNEGPRLTYPLRGGKTSLRAELARRYFAAAGTTPSQQALADALLVLEGMGQTSEPVELYQRVARAGKSLWLDLGDQTGAAVEITAQGWRVTTDMPVLFRRTALTAALPTPVAGGTLKRLWRMLNVAAADQPLLVAYLVSSLIPDIAHPILGLFGEQGTGKSTAAKVVTKMVDQSPVPLRKPPRDAESWVTAASGSWIVALDNLSFLPDWLSDSLCRASTGDGDVRRKLYTDGELVAFAFLRCVIVTGIDLGALHGDFADRLLHIDLELIDEEHRLDDDDLWAGWDAEHPRLLGALLDLTAGMIAALPSVRLARKPRMADFAKVLAALDGLNGTDGVGRYRSKVGMVATDSLTGDPFVVALAAQLVGRFEGTATELLAKVTPADDKWRAPKGWPANAREVTRRLRRQAPVMRKAGWVADDLGADNHAKTARWRIARPEMAGNPSPPDPHSPRDGADAGNAGGAGQEYGQSQDAQSCQRCEASTVRVDDQGAPLCMACGGAVTTRAMDDFSGTLPLSGPGPG
jgi:hypothetical protein